MPSVDFNSTPADIRWPVIRGDAEDMGLQFFKRNKYFGEDDPRNEPLDISGRDYEANVSVTKGKPALFSPLVTVDDAELGMLTVSMAEEQSVQLVNSIYKWELIENPDTDRRRIVVSNVTVAAGATTP